MVTGAGVAARAASGLPHTPSMARSAARISEVRVLVAMRVGSVRGIVCRLPSAAACAIDAVAGRVGEHGAGRPPRPAIQYRAIRGTGDESGRHGAGVSLASGRAADG